jgi:lipooligosaccharide transport system ATP-binding protein
MIQLTPGLREADCRTGNDESAGGRRSQRRARYKVGMTDAPIVSPTEMERPTTEQETDAAITLRGFVKRFGPITAVDGLDLEVPYGTCVGLLGPNGAGKSTTMKALTAQVIPDEGELEVLGYRLPDDSKQARAQMGVVPQLDNLDVALTVEQNLLVFAHLYRIPTAERKDAVERALEIALLADRRAAPVAELSGGMRRRLLIARALIHQPRLVLLDEPTVGLDPQVRQGLWALIDGMRAEGVSILMSTHYIEEAERLCDRVTIMSHGKAVAVGAPRELIAEHAGAEAIEVYGPPPRLVEVERLARDRGWSTRRTGTSVSILHANGAGEIDGVRRVANLEDVFVLLTGEEIT